ncbi:sporulation histidine kinase inhibitor Sda [Paenibacillus psychroresistens]|uniref:Sporulation histidine kinase inhibitor Sda n=1 Tax=Paenibacillus psychroresistens TaxID=1778678 RepID=A0A6B8RNP0_9BACL|nr:sporulation histidine kinase inhibitor Sda [Paenibacillus psychroresistens]
MFQLNDHQLISCYRDAIKHKLENKFIQMLLEEINKRNIISFRDNSQN